MTLKEAPFRSSSTQVDGYSYDIPFIPDVQWEKFADKKDLNPFNKNVRVGNGGLWFHRWHTLTCIFLNQVW
jgi:hypothetical protein